MGSSLKHIFAQRDVKYAEHFLRGGREDIQLERKQHECYDIMLTLGQSFRTPSRQIPRQLDRGKALVTVPNALYNK